MNNQLKKYMRSAFDELKEVIKTPIKKIVERALNATVEQYLADTIFVHNMENWPSPFGLRTP